MRIRGTVDSQGLKFGKYSGKEIEAEIRFEINEDKVLIDLVSIEGIWGVFEPIKELLPLEVPIRDGSGLFHFKIKGLSGVCGFKLNNNSLTGYIRAFPLFHLCGALGNIKFNFKSV